MYEESRPVSIYMPKDLIVASRIAAARLDMSRSAFVVQTVERAIAEVSEGQQADAGRQAMEAGDER